MKNHVFCRVGKWWCVAMAAVMTACGDDAAVENVSSEGESGVIDWAVSHVGDLTSRALIEGQGTKSSVEVLQDQCRGSIDQVEGSVTHKGGEHIAIYGNYKGPTDEGLQPLFHNDILLYDEQPNLFSTQWNYPGPRRKWVDGANYVFRAIYPGLNQELQSRLTVYDATLMMLDYPVEVLQEDVLVAVSGRGNPVRLDFRHALAAVRFRFKYQDDPSKDNVVFNDDDELLACWLENTVNDRPLNTGLATVGSMSYGGAAIDDPIPDHANLTWIKSYCGDAAGEGISAHRNYYWKSDKGIPFLVETPAPGLASRSVVATAYSNPGDGELYIRNGGWLMVVPQKITSRVDLCFQTRDNGSEVCRVPLNVARDPMGQARPLEFLAGHRYTYTILFGGSDLGLELDIKPWNELDSSCNIIL